MTAAHTRAGTPFSTGEVLNLLKQAKKVQIICDLSGWPRRNVINLAAQHRMLHDPDTDTCQLPKGATPPPAESVTCSHDQLLAWAAGHARAPVRRLRERAIHALDLLGQERKKAYEDVARAERTRAEREAAEISIQDLERQLAEAKAKLRELKTGRRTPATRADGKPIDWRAVREWAHANNIPCPHTGKVPNAVLEQWRTAHEQATR